MAVKTLKLPVFFIHYQHMSPAAGIYFISSQSARAWTISHQPRLWWSRSIKFRLLLESYSSSFVLILSFIQPNCFFNSLPRNKTNIWSFLLSQLKQFAFLTISLVINNHGAQNDLHLHHFHGKSLTNLRNTSALENMTPKCKDTKLPFYIF